MKKIIMLIILIAVTALASGLGISVYPDSATVSFNYTSNCDTILAILSHPYGTIIDTIRLYPDNSDSSICKDTTVVGLSSWAAASYDISFEIWEQDDGSISAYGNGNHLRKSAFDSVSTDNIIDLALADYGVSALTSDQIRDAIGDSIIQLIDSLKSLTAKIDTSGWMSGTLFGKMYFNPAANRDTVWYVNPTGDTIGYRFWEHVGGTANDPPDSIVIGRK